MKLLVVREWHNFEIGQVITARDLHYDYDLIDLLLASGFVVQL